MVESRLPKGAHIIVKLMNSSVELSQESVSLWVCSLVTHGYLTENDEDIPEQAYSLEEAGLGMLGMLGLGRLFN